MFGPTVLVALYVKFDGLICSISTSWHVYFGMTFMAGGFANVLCSGYLVAFCVVVE